MVFPAKGLTRGIKPDVALLEFDVIVIVEEEEEAEAELEGKSV